MRIRGAVRVTVFWQALHFSSSASVLAEVHAWRIMFASWGEHMGVHHASASARERTMMDCL